jgi:hypothetical protein
MFFSATSHSHEAAVNEGQLWVNPLTPPKWYKTTHHPDGTTTTEVLPERESPGGYRTILPTLIATYAGDRYLNADVECGAQRYNGRMSIVAVRRGMAKLGFDRAAIDKLLREVKRGGRQDRCPRCWD